jgi:nicotinamidase-related amidase
MRIVNEDTVSLVIDIQERLFPAMAEKEVLLKNCRILISGMQELNIPTIATQQYTKGLGETLPEIKMLVPGFSYIEKRDFSCYDEILVRDELAKLNARNVVICGIEAHVCVLQTAVDLKAAGFNPVVVLDCVSSRSESNVRIAVERFRHEGIMMASAESILFELTRSATNPSFKAISNLVK